MDKCIIKVIRLSDRRDPPRALGEAETGGRGRSDMRRIIILAVLAGAMLSPPDTGPARAGTEVTVSVPVADGLKFNLGIRIETWSVSMEGILFLEGGDEQKKGPESVGGPAGRTLHEVHFGEARNFFTIAREYYLAARAVQQTARRITNHWIKETLSNKSKSRDLKNADSR